MKVENIYLTADERENEQPDQAGKDFGNEPH